MRLLILTHISPPAIDGGSKVIHKLSNYFKKTGHSLIRLSSNCSSTDDFVQKHQSVNRQLPVYTVFHRPFKLIGRFSNLFKILAKGPIFKFIPFVKAAISVIKFKPQLIIAGPLPTTIILYAKFFQKITGAKLLINSSFHPTDTEFQNPIFLKILKSADYLWTLTDYETDFFKKNNFTNTIRLGNGVDANFLINPTNIKFPLTPNLLYIGSFAAHKGIDRLIEILNQIPDITLTVAGQPTLYSRHLNFNHPRLRLVTKPNDLQIKKLIDNCTALVLPSRQESFGLVLIEAMARGKPVLVNDIPQLQELITKSRAGLIFNQKNTQKIIDNPKQFGLNGLEYVSKHYTWDKIGEKLCQKLSP